MQQINIYGKKNRIKTGEKSNGISIFKLLTWAQGFVRNIRPCPGTWTLLLQDTLHVGPKTIRNKKFNVQLI